MFNELYRDLQKVAQRLKISLQKLNPYKKHFRKAYEENRKSKLETDEDIQQLDKIVQEPKKTEYVIGKYPKSIFSHQRCQRGVECQNCRIPDGTQCLRSDGERRT